MKTRKYLIEEQDYIAHIDAQLKMYDLVLTLAHEARNLLLNGDFAALLRTLAHYEHEANELYLKWGIPDDYLYSGNPETLRDAMRRELLGVKDDGCPVVDRLFNPCCLYRDELLGMRGLGSGGDPDAA